MIIDALVEKVDTLDPADHCSHPVETIARFTSDGMLTHDTRCDVHLVIAQALGWLDEQTMQVTLHEGILFHDSTLPTADEVVFTFIRITQENAIECPVESETTEQAQCF